MGQEFGLEVWPRRRRVGGDDDRLHRLAHFRIGHADHGNVGDPRVAGQDVFGLLRVDVHAAGDDHVGLAVGEVKVAVLVEVADVTERPPALLGGH
jgi:hypothetical protein